MKQALVLLAVVISGLAAFSCTATTNTTTSLATSPASNVTVTVAMSQNAGQLASAGQTVFASSCTGCHVGGPVVLIGSSASLGRYANAQGLFKFISTNMPLTAPGSLSQQQYLQLTAYLLLQNKYVTADTPLDASLLGQVPLP